MARISNRRLFQSLDDVLIRKEERQMRMASVAEENGYCSRGRHKEPERREAAPMEDRWLESAVADDVMEMESKPSFEPRHQILRMHGVIVRKGTKIHESHGSRGREKKLLCDRRQTIRCEA